MREFDELASAAEKAGYEVFWYGSASMKEIDRLQSLVGCRLPSSFRRFLHAYGGGGLVTASICGIEDDNAALDGGGTVIGATKECRTKYALPQHLVVILLQDGEVCWCLDTAQFRGEECPVVSYDVFGRKVDAELAPTFGDFMRDQLQLYATKSAVS